MALEAKKIIRWLAALVVLAGIAAVVFLVDFSRQPVQEPMVTRPLKMFTVGEFSQPVVRKYPGRVTAKDKAVLAFQVGGQVVEFPTLKGQRVKKGQALAKLDDRSYRNRYNAAKAAYEQAKIYLQRIEQAVKTGAVSKTDLTNAQSAYEQTAAQMAITEKDLKDTILRAPYDAIIADTFIEAYETVAADQPILGIQDIHFIEVEASVPQERILRHGPEDVRDKYRYVVTFDALPHTEFEADVREFTTKADPKTQTYMITFTMPVQDKYTILPGMTATVQEHVLKTAPKTTHLVAPIDAVPVDGQGQYYVWKVRTKGDTQVVHRQDVTIGKVLGEMVEIISGLNKGDRIALQGVQLLTEGQPVREYDEQNQTQQEGNL